MTLQEFAFPSMKSFPLTCPLSVISEIYLDLSVRRIFFRYQGPPASAAS